jgi:hypothetical protein
VLQPLKEVQSETTRSASDNVLLLIEYWDFGALHPRQIPALAN